MALNSEIEPKNINEALDDQSWIEDITTRKRVIIEGFLPTAPWPSVNDKLPTS